MESAEAVADGLDGDVETLQTPPLGTVVTSHGRRMDH